MKVILLIIGFCLLNFFISAKQGKPRVAEKCLVYKVVYNEGRKVDSILLQQIVFNHESMPLTEIEYSNGRNVQYKKEYTYKKRRLTGVTLKEEGRKGEKILYIYSPSGLLLKTKIYYDGKLSIIKVYSYDNLSKTNSIKEYEYSKGKAILNASEVKFFDHSNRVIREIVVNRSGDTTFNSNYYYSPGLIYYKANGSDGNELESYKSFFNKDSVIVNKIFYKKNSAILTESYLYDSLGRLIKKQLNDKSGNILKTEENLYTAEGEMQRVVKNDFNAARKEILEYEGKRIKTEELWQDNAIVVKLYYRYITLK